MEKAVWGVGGIENTDGSVPGVSAGAGDTCGASSAATGSTAGASFSALGSEVDVTGGETVWANRESELTQI